MTASVLAAGDWVKVSGRRGTFRLVAPISSGGGWSVVEVNPASKGEGKAVSGLHFYATDRLQKAGRK